MSSAGGNARKGCLIAFAVVVAIAFVGIWDERDPSGGQLVELFSEKLDSGGPMDLGFSPFKMIDARSGRAIVNAAVRVELGRGKKLDLKTNSLGYIFVPMGDAMAALESTWPRFRAIAARSSTTAGCSTGRGWRKPRERHSRPTSC